MKPANTINPPIIPHPLARLLYGLEVAQQEGGTLIHARMNCRKATLVAVGRHGVMPNGRLGVKLSGWSTSTGVALPDVYKQIALYNRTILT